MRWKVLKRKKLKMEIERQGNLLDCPTYKIEDRKKILNRVYFALLLASKAYDEANWQARETIVRLLREL
jgi:hypothetical protein